MSNEVSRAVGGTTGNEKFPNATIARDAIDDLMVMAKRLGNSYGVWGVGEELSREIY
jgi:hypothetical protein